jgi:hypothetical protein
MFNPVGRALAAVLIGAFVLTQAAVTSAWTPATTRINVATFGGAGDDRGQSMVVDGSGNIYVTGIFKGTADFDPSASTFNLTSTPDVYDAYVAKLNSQGELLWAVHAGGTGTVDGKSVAVDSQGNVYVTGYFTGTADFDPRPNDEVLNLTAAQADVFVWKLSPVGTVVWAKKAGGSGFDSASSLAIDSAGDVYVTGQFIGTAEFDFDGVPSPLISDGAAADVFLWKLDSAGVTRVIVRFGGPGNDRGTGITIDSSGSLYLAGNFEDTADFDPSNSTFNLTAMADPMSENGGAADVFVLKLQNFFLQWAKRAGGTSFDSGNSIDVDSAGNVYVTGNFQGPADFTSNGTSVNLSSVLRDDVFVWKLDSDGDGVWAKSVGSTGTDVGRSVTVDSLGNVYVTGYFAGTADFDPDGSSVDLMPVGAVDVFVWKLSLAGALVWARQSRATTGADGFSIVGDSLGNVYVSGEFRGTADFDPGANTSNLTSNSANPDAFVWKLTSAGAVAMTPTAPASASYRAANKSVTLRWSAVSGAASYVVTTTAGVQKCATTTTNCVVNRLSNGKAYTYVVHSVNADGVRSVNGMRITARPGFQVKSTSLKMNKKIALSSIVTTPSRGKKTWRVTSGRCRLQGTRLVAAPSRGTCKLRLTTARAGSYAAMSTTVSITITR